MSNKAQQVLAEAREALQEQQGVGKDDVITIPKGSGDPVLVYASTYQNKRSIHARTHYRDDDGQLKPTKKGISFPVDRIPELCDALMKIHNANK